MAKSTSRRRGRQLSLALLRGRGGPGRGQGRTKRRFDYVPHRARAYLDPNHPVHVSMSIVGGLPSLRGAKLWAAVRRGFVHGCVYGEARDCNPQQATSTGQPAPGNQRPTTRARRRAHGDERTATWSRRPPNGTLQGREAGHSRRGPEQGMWSRRRLRDREPAGSSRRERPQNARASPGDHRSHGRRAQPASPLSHRRVQRAGTALPPFLLEKFDARGLTNGLNDLNSALINHGQIDE